MFRDFKAFVMRGNAIDLAVAVVIGAAFGAVVNALVKGILLQIVAALVGRPDFSNLAFTINNARFTYGDVLTQTINFVLVAAAVFFFVVRPMNYLLARSRREPAAEPDTRKCTECLSVVPAQARRCAYCTSELAPGAAGSIDA
jgi:large conductance mechanosensitive channel